MSGDTNLTREKNANYATWDAENSMIMAWLVNSMEEDIASNYMCYSTAKDLWDNINQMYSDLGNQSGNMNCNSNSVEFDKEGTYVARTL